MDDEKRNAPGAKYQRRLKEWVKRQGILSWVALGGSIIALICSFR
jgi:hypothetical protein